MGESLHNARPFLTDRGGGAAHGGAGHVVVGEGTSANFRRLWPLRFRALAACQQGRRARQGGEGPCKYQSGHGHKRDLCSLRQGSISRRTKTEAMEAATAGADETTRKMALVLCENGRLDEMPAVIADYSALMRAHRKEIEVTITSAEALDAEDLSMVKDALTNFKKEGESFIISEKVDSSLLGGVIVQLGDKYVDLSTIKRIREIERILQEPV